MRGPTSAHVLVVGPADPPWSAAHRLALRCQPDPGDIDLGSVGTVLDAVSLIDLTRGDLLTAGTLPGRLRSNDALHLAVALRIGTDQMVTYDTELAAASAAAGLSVTQPS